MAFVWPLISVYMCKVNGFIWLYNAIKDYITLAIFYMVTYSTLLDVYILFNYRTLVINYVI